MDLKLVTDWSKMRYIMFIVYTVSALLASTVASELITSGKQKRQLFREHLLPKQGGKIPETAFEPNRLALNIFNQNGLYSPDGIYLQQRQPNDNSINKRYLPNTLKFNINPFMDNSYVRPQPDRHYLPQKIVNTNYWVRKPAVNQITLPKNLRYKFLPNLPEHSLKLVRQYKYNNKLNKYWQNSIESNNFHEQIFAEFSPLLQKLIKW